MRNRTAAQVQAGVAVVFLCGVLATFVAGCGTKKEVERPMGQPLLQGKSVLMIIAKQNFRDEELAEPRSVLEGAGAKVTVASSAIQESVGMLGRVRATPDLTLKEVSVADYDAVIFVGGTGASEYWDDPTAHQIAKDAHGAGKLVCAICIAPVTLARAGLLEGKKATVFSSESGQLKRHGADYTGASVERDGNIITADGPQSATAFGNAVRDALAAQ